MAFSYTISGGTIIGNKRLNWGTYTNAADTDSGGAITTGLKVIHAWNDWATGQTGAHQSKVTISGGTATLVTGNGVDGAWSAVGL